MTAADGVVSVWHDDEGWGVVASPATPGGCWVHVSTVAAGARTPSTGDEVSFTYEVATQDGYAHRATEVWPSGGAPDRSHRVTTRDSPAYRSRLTLQPDGPGTPPAARQIPDTAAAVSASISCGRALGLRAERAEVIAEGYSVRVLLRPDAVVTRVITLGRQLRPEPLPWLEREVSVARYLADHGVPVVPPWHDPGPHLAEGLEVTLWEWAPHDAAPPPVSAAVFGTMLGDLHAVLATYPEELPLLVGPLTDIRTALAVSGDATLHRAADRLLPAATTWPRRPLHGDAHLGNVLTTHAGPRWIDFEDTCVGPPEWDLASLTLSDEAVAAYPGEVDRERVATCRDLRRLQILVDDPEVLDPEAGDLYRRLVARLDAGPDEGS